MIQRYAFTLTRKQWLALCDAIPRPIRTGSLYEGIGFFAGSTAKYVAAREGWRRLSADPPVPLLPDIEEIRAAMDAQFLSANLVALRVAKRSGGSISASQVNRYLAGTSDTSTRIYRTILAVVFPETYSAKERKRGARRANA